jgi:hypothetical protein
VAAKVVVVVAGPVDVVILPELLEIMVAPVVLDVSGHIQVLVMPVEEAVLEV